MGSLIDLVGQRFGRLTILSRGLNRYGRVHWLCQCDCGKTTEASAGNLRRGNTKSCGCAIYEDLRGRRFGRLTVNELGDMQFKGRGMMWLCTCDCGKQVTVLSDSLRSGNTRSCGCLLMDTVSGPHEKRIVDRAGQRFGRLTVISLSLQRATCGDARWLCRCDCDATVTVGAHHLERGSTRSCGCLKRDLQIKDITGQKFGRLTVIEAVNERGSSGEVKWLCKCSCGKMRITTGVRLRGGKVRSCGCLWIDRMHAQIGPLHPNWKPWLTDEERNLHRNYSEYTVWRKAVYDRDNYTCQKCGEKTSGGLNAHHIEGYATNPELRTTLSNGITLCKGCHRDFHHQYGISNNTREQLEEFLGR